MIKLKELLLNESTYIVYRGDDEQFSEFDYSKIKNRTIGFWFTDNKENAEFYGEYVRKFKITLNDPLIVSAEEFANNNFRGPSYWSRKAYLLDKDGVIIRDIIDGHKISTVYNVFDTHQIQFL
jgi:hypothetical protein